MVSAAAALADWEDSADLVVSADLAASAVAEVAAAAVAVVEAAAGADPVDPADKRVVAAAVEAVVEAPAAADPVDPLDKETVERLRTARRASLSVTTRRAAASAAVGLPIRMV